VSEVEAVSEQREDVLEGFQHRYWRSAPPVQEKLPPLAAENIPEDQFRLIADNIPVLCWIANGDGYIVWYNRRWHDYSGTTPAEMEGWGWQSVHDPEVLPSVMDRWTQSIGTGEPFEMTFPLRGADGVFRPFLTRVQPVRDLTGDVVRWFGVNTEISAQHSAEQALRESDERLRLVLDAAPGGFYAVDREGNTNLVSRGFLDMLAFDHEREVLGRKLHDVIHHTKPDGAPYPVEECPIYRCASTGEPAHVAEESFFRLDGTAVPVEYWATPIYRGGEHIGASCTIVDLRERKRADAALREESRTLETLNRTGSAIAAELDLEKLVQMVTDAGVELSGAQFGAFFYNVLDRSGEKYLLYALSGADRADFDRFGMPRATSIFHPTFMGEGVVRSDDITLDERYGKNDPHHGMPEGHLPVRSYLAVPVISRSGDVIGGLFFGHPEVARFTARHERLISGIAAQAAIGIDNAKLYEAAQKEVAERLRAETALRELNETLERRVAERTGERNLLATLFETTDVMIMAADLEYRILAVNKANADEFERIYGVRPKAGDNLLDLLADQPEHQAQVRAGWTRGLAGEETTFVEDFGDPARERPYYEISFRTLRNEAGDRIGAYHFVTDVTERIRAQADLLEAQEALRQSQKMEAVGQLTGGIAHDFNNLLTIITGNADIARRSLEAGETARAARAIANTQKGAERAATLTQRLLAFSRRQPLAPKPINVDKLVTGMADLLHRALGETVQLETISNPALWLVEADPNQLESAILNLAVNARDAMQEGGKLTIETANARLDEEYSAAHAEVAPGSYVVIAITDTGHGMSKETLTRVFDPFFTTKDVGKGTGLGLSMVYGFVKQSGGHVKIYSEEGEGTTVKIYLPRLMSGEEGESEPSEQTVDRAGREQTVLVVEDDDDVRAYTVEILRELGYRVLEAHDGPSALRLMERQETSIDLLFTDVVMPGISGRELADLARAHQPDLKVLYTSGYTRNAIMHGGRLDHGVEMIAKPFTYQALAEKIREVLDAGKTGRVLVVDHDATVRAFAIEALKSAEYAADEAANASEALNRVRASQGRYDAVLLDSALPDKRGEALVVELRALYANLPILLVSGEQEQELRERFAADKCIQVMGKPYNSARLHEALQALGLECRTSQ
jgi:PAS domain S-box-containing protein